MNVEWAKKAKGTRKKKLRKTKVSLKLSSSHSRIYDRYKRKTKFPTDEPTWTTTTRAHNQSLIQLEIFKRLGDLNKQTVDVGKKFAEILRIE